MTTMRYGEAIDYALGEAMAADLTVVTWGEDVRLIHRQLLARFGPDRVLDTPISEAAFVYAGVGAAMSGLRPVVEVMLVDFLTAAWSAVVNAASKFSDFSGGNWKIPLVIRARVGGWYTDGGQHEQALWGHLASLPSTKVACPATPDDAAGLMLSAVQDDGFVVFLEHKLLSEQFLDYLGGSSRSTVDFGAVVPELGAVGDVPTPVPPVPFGKARIRRRGSDVALVSLAVGVHRCLEAASILSDDGIDAAVLDLRTAAPLDRDAIVDVARTCGRVVVVDEDYLHGGLTGEIAAVLMETGASCSYRRVAVESTIPFAPGLEHDSLPNEQRIVAACRDLMVS
jgi:pyruvate dehydrogenase E1 component beta subunit